MTITVNESKTCPVCGKPLPAGALEGLCPACLLAQGGETEPAEPRPERGLSLLSVDEVAALFPQLEILGLLGAGGMGAVYKARQRSLDRLVALKILPRNGVNGVNFAERFNREARALARLNHPNIVAVHEFGQVDGLHYFLMEFVDGANLRQLERAGRLSPREALQIIPQICDALQYAHDEGVVHRDIKPENVLLDRKGRVKIADFGLAKILGMDGESIRLTRDGQVMGTPHYMAPEQVERPLAVDHRADIYSLGVVFYEMLTGDLPIGKFPPPSRKVELDVRLDDIVLRALENDPERRYQQVSEVKERVETVVSGAPASEAAGESAAGASSQAPSAPSPEVRHRHWLGIPVVTERGEDREVSFNGAITAAGVIMVTVALTLSAFRWITGAEHSAVQICYVAGMWTAILAIRRGLNQPWDDERAEVLARGPAFLRPWREHRVLGDGLLMVGLLAFIIGFHLLKTRVLQPRMAANRSGTAVVERATADPRTGRMKASLPEAQPLRFSDSVQMTFQDLIDFDTARVAEPPAGDGPPLAGIADAVLWAQENGFDAAAGNGELQVLNMTFVPLRNEEWDTLAISELGTRLGSGGYRPRTLQPLKEGELPATFGFRTREDGLGILQLVRFARERPEVTVRFKTVVRPGSGRTGAGLSAAAVPTTTTRDGKPAEQEAVGER